MDDQAFLDHIADALFGLPGVIAVALGGSRAYGDPGPETDWDLAIYYRGGFDPDDLRVLGWPGRVSALGDWGGGVFNGGAWLDVDGRRVDVHYRDMVDVERVMREAEEGIFRIEPLMFHLAGIPTYILLAELALGRTLRGELPVPVYPEALRDAARREWWSRAEMLFDYAEQGFAAKGLSFQAIGTAAEAATCAAHAILAARGQWVTNEKRILALAGLGGVSVTMAKGDEAVASIRAIRERCVRLIEGEASG
jgi:predicted nucleotidyltransferase